MNSLKFLSHPLKRASVLSLRGFSDQPRFQVVEKQDPSSPLASFGLYIGIGSRHEAEQYVGTTHLLKHLVFKSSNSRIGLQVCRDLEVLGANFSATASREYLFLYTSIPKNPKNERYLVNHLFDVIQPKMSAPWEVRELRSIIEEETKEAESNLYTMISENVHKLAFLDYGLGNPLYAPHYNMENLANHQTVTQQLEAFGQGDMVFVHSGASDPEGVSQVASNLGVAWPSKRVKTYPQVFIPGSDHRVNLGGTEIHHVVSYHGVGFNDPDFLSFAVLEKILGSYGFGEETSFVSAGRVKGFVSQYPFVNALTPFNFNYSDTGIFGFYSRTGRTPEIVNYLQTFVFRLLSTIVKDGLLPDELDWAKKNLYTSHLLQLENKETLLKSAAQDALFNSNLSSLTPNLDSVTPDSIKRVAMRLIASRPNYLNYGDIGALPPGYAFAGTPKKD